MLNQFCKILIIAFFTTCAHANETDLIIKFNDRSVIIFTKSQLLSRPDIETITVSGNPAFNNNSHTYQAFKLCNLLNSIKPANAISNIEFKALDGYVSVIPATMILQCDNNKDVAYLAIEPQEKWPALPHGSGTAGPYDLIWRSQGKEIVDSHYWPWQISEINLKRKLDAKNQLPQPNTNDTQIISGYQTFVRSCSGCHTLNGFGSSHMGPDLNKPMSPTQYFKNDNILKKFIRYPQSVRSYKNDRMPGVADTMSENDLNNLIKFFHYMATQP